MSQLPFEALVTDTSDLDRPRYLIDSRRVRYASNLEEALAPAIELRWGDAFLGFASPPSESAIPFNRGLVDKLWELLPNAHVDMSIDREKMVKALAGQGLLHVASHAVLPRELDSLPYLVLNDGPFSAGALDLNGTSRDLVVLASCTSGNGRVFRGEMANGLGQSMIRSGAGAVVHTLWPVDDQATAELLGSMYEHLMSGNSASEALYLAKQSFRERHATDALRSPYHWSGLVLLGHDVRPVDSSRTGLKSVIALTVLFGALALVYLRRRSRSRARSATKAS